MTTVNVVLGTPHIEVDAVTSQVSIVLAGPQGPQGEDGSAGGAGEWGAITGTLADQTDLQAALDDKVDVDAAAGGVLAGTYPNPSFAADMATQAELNAVAAAAVNDGDAAGGVLSGTYPNPGFAADMATQAELDAVSTVADAAIAPGDAAGGVLSGTYPNPGFAADMATQAELDAVSTVADAALTSGDAAGGVLGGTYPNPSFAADMATQAELDAVATAKANLASPTFTGTPAAPTAAAATDTTQVATTAFVHDVLQAVGIVVVAAGADLSTARPTGAATVYWKFNDDTVVPGDSGENIVNGAEGDLWFVPDA